MMFAFPKKRMHDTCWYLDEKDILKHGKITLITIVIKESDECNVWYNVEGRESGIVNESQILENDLQMPTPKWKVGDDVYYAYLDTAREIAYASGTIAKIEVHADGTTASDVQVMYIMQEDSDYWVAEDEIQSFADISIDDDQHYSETN